jgi:hypothetical protein
MWRGIKLDMSNARIMIPLTRARDLERQLEASVDNSSGSRQELLDRAFEYINEAHSLATEAWRNDQSMSRQVQTSQSAEQSARVVAVWSFATCLKFQIFSHRLLGILVELIAPWRQDPIVGRYPLIQQLQSPGSNHIGSNHPAKSLDIAHVLDEMRKGLEELHFLDVSADPAFQQHLSVLENGLRASKQVQNARA